MNTKILLSASVCAALPFGVYGQPLLNGEQPLLPIPQAAVLEQEEYELVPIPMQPAPVASAPTNVQSSQQDQLLSAAIQQQNIPQLKQLLAQPAQEGDNPLLRLDAQAAVALSQRDFHQAIENYQQILNNSPDSDGVRLDLATSLFADKRYREAKREFEYIQQHTPSTSAWHQKAEQYLNAIAKSEQWRPNVSFNYIETDNVNNATEENSFVINGMTFNRREEDKPIAARGVAYQLGISREHNVGQHHFLTGGVHVGGTHYFGQSEYSEQMAQAQAGYRYQNAQQSLGIVPFFTQRWLGGEQYSRGFGLKADYLHRFGQQNQWSSYTALQHEQIRYQDERYQRYYDGFSNTLTSRVQKSLGNHWVVFAGAQTDKIHRQSESESSHSYGGHLGFHYSSNTWGVRLYARYNHRQFDSAHYLFRMTRQDNEWRVAASIYHKKLSWQNIMPELNYVYDNVSSNIHLYNRRSGQFFLSLTKSF